MADERSFFDIFSSGWFIAIAAATWGIILRVIIGRYEASNRRQEARLVQLEAEMVQIKISLASIAGRMMERDHRGNYTWPGDSR
jgi:hypothetical protein